MSGMILGAKGIKTSKHWALALRNLQASLEDKYISSPLEGLGQGSMCTLPAILDGLELFPPGQFPLFLLAKYCMCSLDTAHQEKPRDN